MEKLNFAMTRPRVHDEIYIVVYLLYLYVLVYTCRHLSKIELYYIRRRPYCGRVFTGYRIFHAQTFTLRKWIRIARRYFDFYFRHVSFAKICPPPRRFWIRNSGGRLLFSATGGAFVLFSFGARVYCRFQLKFYVSTLSRSPLFAYPTECARMCVHVWEIERFYSYTFRNDII